MEVVTNSAPAAHLEEMYRSFFAHRESAYSNIPTGNPSQEGLAFQSEAILHLFEFEPIKEAVGLAVSSRVRSVTQVYADLTLKQSVERRREIRSGQTKHILSVTKKLLEPRETLYERHYLIIQGYDGTYSAVQSGHLAKSQDIKGIDRDSRPQPMTWFDLACMSADVSFVEDRVRSVSRSLNLN